MVLELSVHGLLTWLRQRGLSWHQGELKRRQLLLEIRCRVTAVREGFDFCLCLVYVRAVEGSQAPKVLSYLKYMWSEYRMAYQQRS